MEKAERVLRLYRERYEGWNVKHFHERLEEEHQIKLSYTWVKAALQGAGVSLDVLPAGSALVFALACAVTATGL